MFGFKSKKEVEVFSPVVGKSIALSEVKDDVFSQKMMGDGLAFEIREGEIYAPCDCEVTMLFPTLHAIGLKVNDVEILIHIGLETVSLNGDGFKSYVENGQKLKRGQKMIIVDLDVLKKNNIDSTTMMIITSKNHNLTFNPLGNVSQNDLVMKVK